MPAIARDIRSAARRIGVTGVARATPESASSTSRVSSTMRSSPPSRPGSGLAEGGGWLVGGRFTVADLSLAEVLRYAQPAKELFDERPGVDAWIKACQARPAFRAMWAARETETV